MLMRKLKLYLETTVFNWYFEPERSFHSDTVRFFEEIAEGRYEAFTSQYVIDELILASEPRLSEVLSLLEKHPITILDTSQETEELASAYAEHKIISHKHVFDRLHLASATVNGMDAIISFNFSHINRLWTKEKIQAVNQVQGYNRISINLPMEVVEYEES